jgi:DNA-binding phage protein
MRPDTAFAIKRVEAKLDSMIDALGVLAVEVKKLRTQAQIELAEPLQEFETPEYTSSTFANNLRFLMARHGYKSVSTFAKTVGIAQPTCYRWMFEEAREPRLSTIAPIAKAFGLAPSDLLTKDLREQR